MIEISKMLKKINYYLTLKNKLENTTYNYIENSKRKLKKSKKKQSWIDLVSINNFLINKIVIKKNKYKN